MTGNLLDYEYDGRHYNLTAIDLSKQRELVKSPDLKQQTNFIGRLEEDETMFFVVERTEGTGFGFSQNAVTVV